MAGSVFCVAAASHHSSSGSGAGPVFCIGDSGSRGLYVLVVGDIFLLGRVSLLPGFSRTPS